MSKSLNSVEFIGYVGRDPESVSLNNHKNIVRFPLATHEVWRDADSNQLQTHTDWHRIVVMGKQASVILAQLKKGALIYCRGKLRTRRYHDREDCPRFITEVLALQILFLNHPSESDAEEPDGEWVEHDDQSIVE